MFFHTPLFFEKGVLKEFEDGENYEVEYSTDFLGKIEKTSNEGEALWKISFGISPKGFVHCFLLDILELAISEDPPIKLTQEEAEIFSEYLFKPDRLGKHFSKTMLEAEPVKPGEEN